MKKIAFIAAVPYPNDSSASGNRVLSIAKGLVHLGISVDILSLRLSISENEVILCKGVRCLTYSGHPLGGYSVGLRQWLAFFRFVVRYFNANPDVRIAWVVNFRDVDMIAMALVAKMVKLKLIREVNEYPSLLLFDRVAFRDEVGWFVEKYLMTYFLSGMTLMTKALMRFYGEHGRTGCRLVHMEMTVDPSRFIPDNTYDLQDGYVAYCGSMQGEKDGVSDLIRAFGLVAREYPGVSLRLYGDADAKSMARLQSLVSELGLANRIAFPGRVPMSEIPAIITKALVLALTRPNNKQAEGGFPTKLGEYLCTGRPVVVSKVGEIPDYLEDRKSAFLCEPSDPESAAKCFRDIFKDYKNALVVGQRGRSVALKVFNGDVQAKKLHTLACELSKT